jgi:translation initiation factor IF-1
MQRFNVVSAEATILECVSSVLFRVALSNGHQLLAHVEGASAEAFFDGSQCLPGAKLLVELRAFDLSRATVLRVLVA